MPVRPPLTRFEMDVAATIVSGSMRGCVKAGGPGSSEDDPPGPNPTPETVVTDGV